MDAPQNAKNAKGLALHNILLIGQSGSGKTTQFWTLPGRGFIYIFDPNAIASIEGLDVDYERFSPDLLDINVHPLSNKKEADRTIRPPEPITYNRWEEHFEEALETGFFDQYDWVGMDSFTTFSDCVMDRVQYLNSRLGKQPEQDDWAAQMATIHNVFRSMSALDKLFVATAHDELRQEGGGNQRMKYQPVMTGRLRTRIPLLFSNILRCECDSDASSTAFVFHLANDNMHQYVRVAKAIRDALRDDDGTVPPEVDVTIDDFSNPTRYGLGRILERAGMSPVSNEAASTRGASRRKQAKGAK